MKQNLRRRASKFLQLTLARPEQLGGLQRKLLAWFRTNKRALPWRKTRDGYRIWVSEVMLQQTRVAAMMPYYERFLKRFPSVRALARAPEPDVLKAWAGLGYYSRARNLQRAAKEIVKRHAGRFPRTLEGALALPGVGRYTAAAVLSIAYDLPLAVLDGNVARVLARLAAVRGDLRQSTPWKQLEAAAQSLLPAHGAGDWNQAMMELGATVCTPQTPKCGQCPVSRFCQARALNLQSRIPAPRKKRPPEDVRVAAAVLFDRSGQTLLVKPEGGPDDGLFSRMWQFPAVRVASRDGSEAALKQHLLASLGIQAQNCVALLGARHTVTYRRVTLLPFLAPVEEIPEARGRILLRDVDRWPTSSATRKIARIACAAARQGNISADTQRSQRGMPTHCTAAAASDSRK